MTLFSQFFRLGKTQSELDFVDVPVDGDIPLFVDPFANSQRLDRWSQECHRALITFFQGVVDKIRSGRYEQAKELLLHLREPNETRLGLSAGRPQGAGIGSFQADLIYEALRDSSAVRTGFLSSLEECELMIEGIGWDKISDLTTNIIRSPLADYSREQCTLHNVPVEAVAQPACFDPNLMQWVARYLELPMCGQLPVLLVPKAIARFSLGYDHNRYYRHFVLNYLRTEALEASSALVRTLKNGRKVVYKKDLERIFPCTKDLLYRFSREHPHVLEEYRESLERLERIDQKSEVDPEDEAAIAAALVRALESIPPGNARASEYHNLMVGVVEFLFFPNLLYPRKEREIHEGRKRIDIVMENGARGGIFYRLHDVRRIPCAYVPFECKNYLTEVANPELDQLAGRFSINRGMVGFLCCRRFENRALFIRRCKDTIVDGRGLILPFDDETITRYLNIIGDGQREELELQLSRLVDEVCL